jgi:chromate reductase, NAD(P)H dehydrogenase (quinone)
MTTPKILALAGSARKDSFNRKLVQVAAEGARSAGADVTVLNLKDYPLPFFDEDLEREEGTPENASKLKQLFLEHDGLLISSPEYNSSIAPLLKNAIDWVSRPAEGEPRLAAYQGKVAAIMAASPGALGGLRGLVHVRSILSSIGVIVLPDQVAIPNAYEAFDDTGRLKDERKQANVEGLGRGLADIVGRISD